MSDEETKRDDEKSGTSGGVSFGNVGGGVNVGGSVVGRDAVTTTTTTTTTTTGIDAAGLAQLLQQFQQVQKKIDDLPESPDVDKDELKATVKKIEDEVKKGEEANPSKVERWIKFVAGMSKDIAQVTAAALVNPAAGVGTAIRLIAAKAAQETKS
jgi:hypothetical protein